MNFGTKEELIKRYASKRLALEEDDVEDLLNCFIGYTIKNLSKQHNIEDFAFRIDNLGTFYEYEFDPSKLTTNHSSPERQLTEKKLAEYILTGIVRPKKISIKDDRNLRI